MSTAVTETAEPASKVELNQGSGDAGGVESFDIVLRGQRATLFESAVQGVPS